MNKPTSQKSAPELMREINEARNEMLTFDWFGFQSALTRVRRDAGYDRLTQDVLAPRGDGERHLTLNNVPNK